MSSFWGEGLFPQTHIGFGHPAQPFGGTTQLEISVGNKSQLEIFDFQPHGSVRNICDSVGNICDSVRNICDSVGNICDSVRNN